jgi:leucyl aminopeptidase
MIALSATRTTLPASTAELTAFLVPSDRDAFRRTTGAVRSSLGADAAPLGVSPFAGKEGESLLLYHGPRRGRRLLLVGVGTLEKLSLEKLRRAAAAAITAANAQKVRTLLIMEPDASMLDKGLTGLETTAPDAIACSLAEGAALAAYRFDKYLTGKNRPERTVRRVAIGVAERKRLTAAAAGVRRASVLAEATCLARDLANAPGNELYPASLARRAAEAGRAHGFRVRVLLPPAIRSLGMGGVLGVGAGSARPPRFIVMEYRPSRARRTAVLVGKGVTFDTGGISIKPSANMAEMRMDMSGAAAVIGALSAAARLKVPVRVIGLVPAVENMPGGAALKPGDILTHMNGMTSEVDNTDAEGRLILADALCYAARFDADVVIDLATLTGACVVALGHHASGMMGNDEPMMERLRASGERVFERVWPLPLFEEYERQIKSDVADVRNVGGRWAGAITAALFLKKFVGKQRWIHLDIAGTAIQEEATPYTPKGGSGVGVRLLADFLQGMGGR